MKSRIVPCIILCAYAILFSNCKREQTGKIENIEGDSIETVTTVNDSTLWGHLGTDTGMSALQFITDDNDTLELYRTDPYTGTDGRLTGDIRNYTDRFAITISADGESMTTAINATQLAQTWNTENGSIDMKDDGVIISKNLAYDGWKLWNGRILLSSQQQMEYGLVNRVDTMDIMLLTDDSLVIRNHINQILSFSN